jgi:hypothetical protein
MKYSYAAKMGPSAVDVMRLSWSTSAGMFTSSLYTTSYCDYFLIIQHACVIYDTYKNTFLLIHLWSWALLRKPPIVQLLKKFKLLMQPESRLPYSKSPPLVPILIRINLLHTIPSYLSKIHFNIIHTPTSGSSQWSPSFRLSHHYSIGIPLRPPYVLHALTISSSLTWLF